VGIGPARRSLSSHVWGTPLVLAVSGVFPTSATGMVVVSKERINSISNLVVNGGTAPCGFNAWTRRRANGQLQILAT